MVVPRGMRHAVGPSSAKGAIAGSCRISKGERGASMATRGSALRAEGNGSLPTLCVHCGTSIPTEVFHAQPLDQAFRRGTWGLHGHTHGAPCVFRPFSA